MCQQVKNCNIVLMLKSLQTQCFYAVYFMAHLLQQILSFSQQLTTATFFYLFILNQEDTAEDLLDGC